MAVPKEIVDFHVRTPDVTYDVTRLGTRPDFLEQHSLELSTKLHVAYVSVKRLLTRPALAQSSEPIVCQNCNVFARFTGRALVTVFNDIPTERLDHLGKQQYLRSERAHQVILV